MMVVSDTGVKIELQRLSPRNKLGESFITAVLELNQSKMKYSPE
jgi:hypothetical protein